MCVTLFPRCAFRRSRKGNSEREFGIRNAEFGMESVGRFGGGCGPRGERLIRQSPEVTDTFPGGEG